MESVMIFKMLDVLLSQPIHFFIMAVAVAIATGVIKCVCPIVKKLEVTYFVPYILSMIAIMIYAAIMKISFKENIGQILINGIYIALLSSIIFQLYKAVKDIGLKVLLKDAKAFNIFQELKLKLNTTVSAISYAQRIATMKSDDLNGIIETMRGSGIEDKQLFSLANDLSIILQKNNKEKPKNEKKQAVNGNATEGEVADDECNRDIR